MCHVIGFVSSASKFLRPIASKTLLGALGTMVSGPSWLHVGSLYKSSIVCLLPAWPWGVRSGVSGVRSGVRSGTQANGDRKEEDTVLRPDNRGNEDKVKNATDALWQGMLNHCAMEAHDKREKKKAKARRAASKQSKTCTTIQRARDRTPLYPTPRAEFWMQWASETCWLRTQSRLRGTWL